MTQEDKELLLRDLSARLPYGVKVQAFRRHSEEDPSIISYPYTLDFIMMSIMFKDNIEEYKPYLFPLSSMTEKQKEEFNNILSSVGLCYAYDANNDMIIFSDSKYDKNNYILDFDKIEVWLNKNHFDYRNLIGKNLAIDAAGKNIY